MRKTQEEGPDDIRTSGGEGPPGLAGHAALPWVLEGWPQDGRKTLAQSSLPAWGALLQRRQKTHPPPLNHSRSLEGPRPSPGEASFRLPAPCR